LNRLLNERLNNLTDLERLPNFYTILPHIRTYGNKISSVSKSVKGLYGGRGLVILGVPRNVQRAVVIREKSLFQRGYIGVVYYSGFT